MFVPQAVPRPCSRRADIGVAVVSVYSPRLQHSFDITLVTRSADVIHYSVLSLSLKRGSDFGRDFIQCLIPVDSLPLAFTPLTDSLEGVEDSFCVVDLVDCGRTLGTGPAPAARVMWITLELGNLATVLVDIGKHTAG